MGVHIVTIYVDDSAADEPLEEMCEDFLRSRGVPVLDAEVAEAMLDAEED